MQAGRILVVDDDPNARSGLELLLQAEGFVVSTADNGSTALDNARQQLPDVVLTDLKMPRIDGIELCRRLHELDPDLPVIVTTGSSEMESAVESLRAGTEDYLVKPLDFDMVLRAVQRAIERRAARLEQAHLRIRAEQFYQEALTTARAHDNMLSAVAHDLNNPLGVISIQAQQLAKRDGNDAATMELTAAILRATGQMRALLSNLLEDAKMRGGQGQLRCAPHRVNDLLRDASDLRPLALQRRVVLEVGFETNDQLVWCDRVRVGQVLANLISTAIKFTPKGRKIRVTASSGPEGVRFEVRDEGPGISEESIPHIFDRLWQAKEAAHVGVGLGLFIARGIVESHGGKIWVESQLGQGSAFFCCLPPAPAATAAEPTARRTRARARPSASLEAATIIVDTARPRRARAAARKRKRQADA